MIWSEFVFDNWFLWNFDSSIFLSVKLIVVENRLSNINEVMKIILLLIFVSKSVSVVFV